MTTAGPSAFKPSRSVFSRASLADPQQPPAAGVDLVDHGQEVVGLHAVSPVNLVDGNGFDATELAMLQTPLHEPLHRAIDRFPTGLKSLRRLPPAQPSRPAGEKAHHGHGHRPLAVAPGNVFDHYPVLSALHPPWRITEPGRFPPKWHKQPTPLGYTVIPRCGLPAQRTASANAAMRGHGDLDPRGMALAVGAEAHVLINRANKGLYSIQ